MQFDTVTVVAIVVIVIGAGYLLFKRRSRAS
ncbi:MAG TPA: LPXTG cell wall anchor domain-containing protein [Pyrinomonadaceae bacterium]|nr:LPXTG cell wall anchor domain-containing protein [Pyrinomonadaceae bacterium]